MADKVKTFVMGMVNGYESAFEGLDKRVAELGDIEVKTVDDQYLCRAGLEGRNARPGIDECVKRTIIYRQK